MGLIYGNKFLSEEILEEQVILNEMHFSKKDLQDPKTIDKIIKRKEFFESVVKFIDFLFLGITVIGSCIIGSVVSFGAGLGTLTILSILTVNIVLNINSLPLNIYNKNIDKYKKKIEGLINICNQNIEKDVKNKDKYKQIIDNCKKVQAKFDEMDKESKLLAYKEEYKDCLSAYKDIVYWLEKPYVLGHTGERYTSLDDLRLANSLGITDKDIIKNITSKCKFEDKWDILFSDNDEESAIFFKDDKYILISSDDDHSIIYSKNKGKLYELYAYDKFNETSLVNHKFINKKFNIDIVKQVDKELGYYLLSKCPEQVKKKEFPIKCGTYTS